MCVNVVFVSDRVCDVTPQVLEVLGEGDRYSFYFDDCCSFAFGIFFVLMCASIFLTLFFLEGQGVVGEVSEQ